MFFLKLLNSESEGLRITQPLDFLLIPPFARPLFCGENKVPEGKASQDYIILRSLLEPYFLGDTWALGGGLLKFP